MTPSNDRAATTSRPVASRSRSAKSPGRAKTGDNSGEPVPVPTIQISSRLLPPVVGVCFRRDFRNITSQSIRPRDSQLRGIEPHSGIVLLSPFADHASGQVTVNDRFQKDVAAKFPWREFDGGYPACYHEQVAARLTRQIEHSFRNTPAG